MKNTIKKLIIGFALIASATTMVSAVSLAESYEDQVYQRGNETEWFNKADGKLTGTGFINPDNSTSIIHTFTSDGSVKYVQDPTRPNIINDLSIKAHIDVDGSTTFDEYQTTFNRTIPIKFVNGKLDIFDNNNTLLVSLLSQSEYYIGRYQAPTWSIQPGRKDSGFALDRNGIYNQIFNFQTGKFEYYNYNYEGDYDELYAKLYDAATTTGLKLEYTEKYEYKVEDGDGNIVITRMHPSSGSIVTYIDINKGVYIPVPEPSSSLLFSIGIIGFLMKRTR